MKDSLLDGIINESVLDEALSVEEVMLDSSRADSVVEAVRFCQDFNGQWGRARWQHWCAKGGEGQDARMPCCTSIDAAKRKLANRAKGMVFENVWDRLSTGSKKWGENGRRCSKIGLLCAVHQMWPQLAKAWKHRQNAAGINPEQLSDEEHVYDNDRVKTAKRARKSMQYWQDPSAPSTMSALSVATKPARRFLSELFLVERDAKLAAALRKTETTTDNVPAGEVGPDAVLASDGEAPAGEAGLDHASLLGKFVNANGLVDQTQAALEGVLTGTKMTQPHCQDVLSPSASTTSRRGMCLRACASFRHRVRGPLKRADSSFGMVRYIEGSDAERTALEEQFGSVRECCGEPYFWKRAKRRLKGNFKLLRMRQHPAHKFVRWASKTPPVLSIVGCENLHAHMSNRLKASRSWKSGFMSVSWQQGLVRWRNLHPKRVQLEKTKLKKQANPQIQKRTRTRTKSSTVVTEIGRIVKDVCASSQRSRAAPEKGHRRSGAFLLFYNEALRNGKAQKPGQWTADELQEFNAEQIRAWHARMAGPQRKQTRQAKDVRKPKEIPRQAKRTSTTAATTPWGIGDGDRPLSVSNLEDHRARVTPARRWRQAPMQGLRHFALSSDLWMRQKYGNKAPSRYISPPDDNDFNKELVTKSRKTSRSCSDIHPGLCRELDRAILTQCKRLALELFTVCVSKVIGVELFMIGSGREALYFFPSWSLAKPKRMILVMVKLTGTENFPCDLEIEVPVRYCYNFEMAKLLITSSPGRTSWNVTQLHHEAANSETLVQLRATGVVRTDEVTSKGLKRKLDPAIATDAKDPLEQALADSAAPAPPPPPKRRHRRIGPNPESASISTSDIDADSTSSDRDLCLGGEEAPQTQRPAPRAAPRAAFFWTEEDLGLGRVEMKHPGRAKCKICSDIIGKDAPRCTYNWHVKKPRAYIHTMCIEKLEARFLSHAIDVVTQAMESWDKETAMFRDVSRLLRTLGKKVSA